MMFSRLMQRWNYYMYSSDSRHRCKKALLFLHILFIIMNYFLHSALIDSVNEYNTISFAITCLSGAS